MSNEPKKSNGKAAWATSIIGIPSAVILTWVYVAGGMARDVRANSATCASATVEFRKMDQRVTKLETIYERTSEDITEIKGMLRERRQEVRVP